MPQTERKKEPKPKKYVRASSDEVTEMVEKWKNGASYTSIAESTHFTVDQVKNKIRYHLRKTGEQQGAKAARAESRKEKTLAAAEKLAAGAPPEEIEEIESLNVKKETVLRKTVKERRALRLQKSEKNVGGGRSANAQTPDKKRVFRYTNEEETQHTDSHSLENIFAKAATVRWLQSQSYEEIAESLGSSPEHVGFSIRAYLSEHPEVIREWVLPLHRDTVTASHGATPTDQT